MSISLLLIHTAGMIGCLFSNPSSKADLFPIEQDKVSQAKQSDVEVAIAVPERFGKRSLSLKSPFHVVVQNRSEKKVRIWREWCSWGYFQLRFEGIDANGEKFVIQKKPQIWDKNYPDFWTLDPKEPLIWKVQFDENKWDGIDHIKNNPGDTFQLKAIFTNKSDSETKSKDVWTGSVESSTKIYHINR